MDEWPLPQSCGLPSLLDPSKSSHQILKNVWATKYSRADKAVGHAASRYGLRRCSFSTAWRGLMITTMLSISTVRTIDRLAWLLVPSLRPEGTTYKHALRCHYRTKQTPVNQRHP